MICIMQLRPRGWRSVKDQHEYKICIVTMLIAAGVAQQGLVEYDDSRWYVSTMEIV